MKARSIDERGQHERWQHDQVDMCVVSSPELPASAYEPRPYDGVAAGHIQAPAVMRATMSAMGTSKVGDSAPASAAYHARHWAEAAMSRAPLSGV